MSGMQRRHLLALAASAAACPPLAFAQAPAPFTAEDLAHAIALRDKSLGAPLAYSLVSSLVTEVGPRPVGSPAYDRAVAWALARMERLGLSNVRSEPLTAKAWRRGATDVAMTSPERRAVVAVLLGNSVGGVELDAEVAYYPDIAALRADTSTRAQGRIVFIDQKMERTRGEDSYGKAVAARTGGAVEAGKRGAVAVAIRSIGTDHDAIAHTGGMRYDPQVKPIPSLAVSIPDAERIAAWQAAGKPLRMEMKIAPTSIVEVPSANVVGEIPGTDLANEVVLVGAHLDSWDITPGALDDGAGVGIALATGRALVEGGKRPRRTVRIVLFANEENGVDGARAYAQRHKDVPHQLVGESDFGSDRIWRMRMSTAPAARDAAAAIADVLKPLGIAYETGEADASPDAAVISRIRGWPAIELMQDGTKYFDVHHTVADTLDKIDPATMPQNVAAWSAVAWLASQSRVSFGSLAKP